LGNSCTDYNSEMKWFEELSMLYLAHLSVIAVDNTSIYSVVMDETPCMNTHKSDVIAWLHKNIMYTVSQTRGELLQLVKVNKPKYKSYK
jgi:hypothetical protein